MANRNLHVIPDDGEHHIVSADCTCAPTKQSTPHSGGEVFIHKAADGSNAVEWPLRSLVREKQEE